MQVGDLIKWVPMSIANCEEERGFHWPGYHDSHVYGGALHANASDGWGPTRGARVVTVKLPASGSPYGLCTKAAGDKEFTFQPHVNAIVNYEPPSSPPPPDAPPPPSPPSIQVIVGDFFTSIWESLVGIYTAISNYLLGIYTAISNYLVGIARAYSAAKRTLPWLEGALTSVVVLVVLYNVLRQLFFCLRPEEAAYKEVRADGALSPACFPMHTLISPLAAYQNVLYMPRRVTESSPVQTPHP